MDFFDNLKDVINLYPNSHIIYIPSRTGENITCYHKLSDTIYCGSITCEYNPKYEYFDDVTDAMRKHPGSLDNISFSKIVRGTIIHYDKANHIINCFIGQTKKYDTSGQYVEAGIFIDLTKAVKENENTPDDIFENIKLLIDKEMKMTTNNS